MTDWEQMWTGVAAIGLAFVALGIALVRAGKR